MTEEDRKNLEDLRTRVLDDIMPLLEGDAFEPGQRFALLVSAARSTGQPSTLLKAYDAAKAIEDQRDQADALLEILEEVDVQLGDVLVDEEQPASAEPEEPGAEVQGDTSEPA